MNNRPHIVIDALQVHERPTGVALASLEYLAELSLADRGFRFTVLASHTAAFEFLAGIDYWQVISRSEFGSGVAQKAFYTQWGLPRLLSSLRADLLHSLQFVTPLRAPCPVVTTVHDMAWRLHRETIEQPRRSYYRFLVPRCLANAAAIVTNSEATAQDVRRCLPGLSAQVQVTPFGTPTWLETYRESATNKGDNRPYFLFVGTLEPRKNLVNLLAAFAAFLTDDRNGNPGCQERPQLVLAGGLGWRASEIQAAIDDFAFPEQLVWVGYQSNQELATLYSNAIALVFPSLYEGFGLPILEAMSMGLPVMTSARGAMAEVAADAAILVDPLDIQSMADSLAKLANNRLWRDSWIIKGKRRSKDWSWRQTVAGTLPIYRKLIS